MRFYLVGFMGAGKTTLGRRVAERLGLPFFDLDGRVEQIAGKGISEIFADEGEEGFRKRESMALKELTENAGASVIALGGGAFTVEANRSLMKASGLTVWLDVPAEKLIARAGSGEGRPMYRSASEAQQLLEARRGVYALADRRVELRGKNVDEDAEALFGCLTEHSECS